MNIDAVFVLESLGTNGTIMETPFLLVLILVLGGAIVVLVCRGGRGRT